MLNPSITVRLADTLPPSLIGPVRYTVFAARQVKQWRRGKVVATKPLGIAWHGWNHDQTMEARMARLRGAGSFYWNGAVRALAAAKAEMAADPAVHQIKLETISGREIARLYRVA